MVDALVFDNNLSIMASDAATKSPLAVMLNGVFHRDEIDMPRQEVDTYLLDNNGESKVIGAPVTSDIMSNS